MAKGMKLPRKEVRIARYSDEYIINTIKYREDEEGNNMYPYYTVGDSEYFSAKNQEEVSKFLRKFFKR